MHAYRIETNAIDLFISDNIDIAYSLHEKCHYEQGQAVTIRICCP